jgi:diaminopimelate epimerase
MSPKVLAPAPRQRPPFVKMNGAGNDFVVVTAPRGEFDPTEAEVRALCDRRRGLGCDQLVQISRGPGPDEAELRFWNADGAPAGACGNGSRCAALLVMQASGADAVRLKAGERLLRAWRAEDGRLAVDMGPPALDWRDIPLAEPMDTRGVELQVGPIDAPVLHTPGCVSMGNPHVVFFVPDAARAPVAEAGPLIEHHPLFPEGVNVGFCEVEGEGRLFNRVWERGAGLTKACGTGACAALVAAARRGLCGRRAVVRLDGGELLIDWRLSDDHVIMTGPVEIEFEGTLP